MQLEIFLGIKKIAFELINKQLLKENIEAILMKQKFDSVNELTFEKRSILISNHY